MPAMAMQRKRKKKTNPLLGTAIVTICHKSVEQKNPVGPEGRDRKKE